MTFPFLAYQFSSINIYVYFCSNSILANYYSCILKLDWITKILVFERVCFQHLVLSTKWFLSQLFNFHKKTLGISTEIALNIHIKLSEVYMLVIFSFPIHDRMIPCISILHLSYLSRKVYPFLSEVLLIFCWIYS